MRRDRPVNRSVRSRVRGWLWTAAERSLFWSGILRVVRARRKLRNRALVAAVTMLPAAWSRPPREHGFAACVGRGRRGGYPTRRGIVRPPSIASLARVSGPNGLPDGRVSCRRPRARVRRNKLVRSHVRIPSWATSYVIRDQVLSVREIYPGWTGRSIAVLQGQHQRCESAR